MQTVLGAACSCERDRTGPEPSGTCRDTHSIMTNYGARYVIRLRPLLAAAAGDGTSVWRRSGRCRRRARSGHDKVQPAAGCSRTRQQAAEPAACRRRQTAAASAAHAFYRGRRGRCRHSRHAGCAVLGRFRGGLHQGAAAAAGPVAGAVERRVGWRLRRRTAQRLERFRQPTGFLGRHRGEHRRADGALCVRRSAL